MLSITKGSTNEQRSPAACDLMVNIQIYTGHFYIPGFTNVDICQHTWSLDKKVAVCQAILINGMLNSNIKYDKKSPPKYKIIIVDNTIYTKNITDRI